MTSLIAGALVLVLLAPAPPVSAASPGPAMVAQAEVVDDRGLIGNIQRLLAERGLDPGPADGVMGPKTQTAIAEYQDEAGLQADGLPSQSLYEHLLVRAGAKSAEENEDSALPGVPDDSGTTSGLPVAGDTAASPPEPQNANVRQGATDPPSGDPAPPPVPSLTGSAWRIVDAAGNAFTLTFAENGKVEGVQYGQFWKWRQSGDQVALTYDNGMGLTVARSAILTGPAAMEGTAQPSRGAPWDWTARRISAPDSTN